MLMVDVGRSEQLHRHGRDFCHLRAGMPLEQQRKVCRLEHMKRVTSLVQQRAHVVIDVDGVHEDQRQLAHRK